MIDNRIIIIGAGASGMMAAGRAAELGANIALLEKTEHPGNKVLLSGKTRCNLTNAKELDDFIAMFGSNGRFLYSAFHRYFRDDLLAFFGRYNVETKTERGGRIFPVSDDARDITKALERYMADHGVQLLTGIRVTGIQVDNGRAAGVQTEEGAFPA
ncbi:MAG: NAD(P)/FAD-dependent oxidoreductase, partial [Dehalococcoidia bacterium]|nr:NAD(P)/FAD-dependent oxidoreductase [Dehalococcoidia bacterium]